MDQDIVKLLRTEKLYNVMPAQSLENLFSGITVPPSILVWQLTTGIAATRTATAPNPSALRDLQGRNCD